MVDIACWVTVYNEERRIRQFLTHAKKWACEIVVADKGSTDDTRSICAAEGCKLIDLPYSDQGCEDYDDTFIRYRQATSANWALGLTVSEIPTRKLIDNLRNSDLLQKQKIEIENVLIPVKIYSFGSYIPNGPWKIGFQPRLLNVQRFRWRKKIHDHIIQSEPRIALRDLEESFILHLTHPDFNKFASSHVAYARREAEDAADKAMRAKEALFAASRFPIPNPADLNETHRQIIAWNVYHLLTALAALDHSEANRNSDKYNALSSALLQKDWSC